MSRNGEIETSTALSVVQNRPILNCSGSIEEPENYLKRTADMLGIKEFLETGAKLGSLWMENYFEIGDPLTNAGGPI